jgi:hypothetical protein
LTLPARLAVAGAAAVAFAAGYAAPAHQDAHGPTLVFGCPRSGATDAGTADEVSAVAARATSVEAAALRRRGGTADSTSAPRVIAVVAIGLPGLDPGSTGPLRGDAERRCHDVMVAWAIVAFRRSGSADACCLDTIFVVLAGRRWFVF